MCAALVSRLIFLCVCVCGAVSRHIWDEYSRSSALCISALIRAPLYLQDHWYMQTHTHAPASVFSIWRSIRIRSTYAHSQVYEYRLSERPAVSVVHRAFISLSAHFVLDYSAQQAWWDKSEESIIDWTIGLQYMDLTHRESWKGKILAEQKAK